MQPQGHLGQQRGWGAKGESERPRGADTKVPLPSQRLAAVEMTVAVVAARAIALEKECAASRLTPRALVMPTPCGGALAMRACHSLLPRRPHPRCARIRRHGRPRADVAQGPTQVGVGAGVWFAEKRMWAARDGGGRAG